MHAGLYSLTQILWRLHELQHAREEGGAAGHRATAARAAVIKYDYLRVRT